MSPETPNPRLTVAETVYRSHGRELWALFYAHCCDPEQARDALQEAFVKLCQHRGPAIVDHRAWLLTVGRNWLRDAARRKRVAARDSVLLDSLPGPDLEAASVAASGEVRL